MKQPWLAALPSAPAWADLSSPALRDQPPTLAILPVFGLADHGTGQALDLEEIVGSGILDTALAADFSGVRVLPPFRCGPSPYEHTRLGWPLEVVRAWLLDVGRSVCLAGVKRLALFVTSPWQEEWLSACAVDLRDELGLRTFVITLRGLGLDLHPLARERGLTAALGEHLGAGPVRWGTALGTGRSALFRPGHFPSAPKAPAPRDVHAPERLHEAAELLRTLLAEMLAGPDGFVAPPPVPRSVRSSPFANGYRSRYLGALTDETWPLPAVAAASWVILPTGAIEQHGPHLPLGVDAVLGQAYLEAALPHLPASVPVWVAPPLAVGRSPEHRTFAGTLTLSTLTFRAAVVETVRSLYRHGFRKFAVLNTHGGNSAVLVPTLRELQVELPIETGVLGGLFKPELPAQEAAFGIHAGEWETSLYLALDPGAVDLTQAVTEYPSMMSADNQLRLDQAPATLAWVTGDISRSGVIGDPCRATADKGRLWLHAQGEALARRIRELAQA